MDKQVVLADQQEIGKPHWRSKHITSLDLALVSVFAALGIILNLLSGSLPRVGDFFGRISFIYAYCLIAGIVLGPIKGGITAGVSDAVVALTLPEGGAPWMPFITLSNIMMAVIPGVFYRVLGRRLDLTIVVSSLVSFVVCTLVLTPIGETTLYNLGYHFYYPSTRALVELGIPVYPAFVINKALKQPLWIVMNMIIAKLILRSQPLTKQLELEKRSAQIKKLVKRQNQLLTHR